jgi:hypothetical protein
MSTDWTELLKLFNDHEVRYLVVGGYAVMKYSEPRFTKDLDLWVEASAENARCVYVALRAFGAPLTNLTEADFAREGFFYQMGRPPTRVDILMSIDGVRFADAWANRMDADLDGVRVTLISRQDLITNKRATGRPQDLLDLANLAVADRAAENDMKKPRRKKK